ncbi:MAG: hypothetical protein ACRDYU_08840 [Actinomycetes bacterium]
MRTAYKVLAFIIAIEVVVQAMAVVYGVAGLGKWVDDGGIFDKTVLESEDPPYSEGVGFAIHFMNGTLLIPLLALLLLIFSFFTKLPGATKWAGVVFLLVVLQITLGLVGHSVPAVGALHGLNAFLLLGAAINTGRLARTAEPLAPKQRPPAEPELV